MNATRNFAIVPAAGHSRRMGRPKLLLPWQGTTVIEAVLDAWQTSRVDRVCMVIRKDDTALAEIAGCRGIDILRPESDPTDMKASVQHAIRHIEATYAPTAADAWLIAPADLPALSNADVDRVITGRHRDKITVPQFQDRRGHPVLFPWRFASQVFSLNEDEGVNAIVQRESTHCLPFDGLAKRDVDTPAEYQRLLEEYGSEMPRD